MIAIDWLYFYAHIGLLIRSSGRRCNHLRGQDKARKVFLFRWFAPSPFCTKFLKIVVDCDDDNDDCNDVWFLSDSLPFSKLDWCDSGMWRWQLKTCWGWYCLTLMMIKVLASVWWSEVWSLFRCWCLVVVTNFNLGRDSEARIGQY